MSTRHRTRPVPVATLTYYMRRNDGAIKNATTFKTNSGRMETQIERYRGTPYGVVVGVILPNGVFNVGYALGRKGEVFNKRFARNIALGRAIYADNPRTPGYGRMMDRLCRLYEKISGKAERPFENTHDYVLNEENDMNWMVKNIYKS